MKAFRPLFLIVAFLLMVGLACVIGGPSTPTDQPTPQDRPTQEEQATPEGQEAATDTPEAQSSGGEQFFTEEFDQDPGSAWKFDVFGPNAVDNAAKATYSFDSSLMVFNIEAKNLYAYYFYDQSYDNVRVDIKFENRGVNSQNISLVCRKSDEGWYEFSVGSDGLWVLWGVSIDNGNIKYNNITNGGSKFVKTGKSVNEYGMSCKEQSISLFINSQEVSGSPFSEKNYGFRRGNVGFNVSSLNTLPVKVEVDWFKISEP